MSLKIYQIYYQPDQISKLDPAFTPLDNSKFTGTEEIRKFREWTVFREIDQYIDRSDHTKICGFLSHKFKEKTNTNGQDFINFINQNPGNDVYVLEPKWVNNPFFNIWEHGEVCHNGIIKLINRIFELSGKNIDVSKIQTSFCFFNTFAGNQKFWNLFVTYINDILKAAELDQYVHKMLFVNNAGYEIDTTLSYFPFVAERIASTIMALHDLKIARMSFHNPMFVYNKDGSDRFGNQWAERFIPPLVTDPGLGNYCKSLFKDGLLL